MRATDELRHEHQVVLLVLKGIAREAGAIAESGRFDAAVVEEVLDFSRNFVDRCHHAKEERYLFPRLTERGLPAEGGPIAVMLAEHEEGRGLVRQATELLPKAKNGDAVAALGRALSDYVALLRAHIDKEEGVLFAAADRLLSDEDQRELASAFERIESEELGAGTHERYHALAHRLAGVDHTGKGAQA
jgi:hemerythrin-like domain-containing protein